MTCEIMPLGAEDVEDIVDAVGVEVDDEDEEEDRDGVDDVVVLGDVTTETLVVESVGVVLRLDTVKLEVVVGELVAVPESR